MSETNFQAPRGVPDYLPPRSQAFLNVRDAFALQAELAGYEYVELPVFEHIEVFTRGIGEGSDVVTKEMYSFDDRGGRGLALRPEGTASVCRVIAQHGLANSVLPVKLWYAGPFFRAERPQQGRFRQLQQVGVEAVGVADPLLDAEVIAMANSGFQSLGLTNYQLVINSLGGSQCRSAYKLALESFMTKALPAEMQDRVRANPLRLLDDKSDKVKAALADAPSITDFWTADDARYQTDVIEALANLGITPHSQPRLVRGLDYYTGTIFEFVHPDLGAQSGIGGGGRYDGLLAALGGPGLTGVGFGVGVDRTLLACEAEGLAAPTAGRVQVFIVPIVDEARPVSFGLVNSLRDSGVSADMVFGERGLKGSMKAADKSGAPLALIVGLDEIQNGVVTIKNLSDSSQTTVAMAEVVPHVCSRLGVVQ